MYIEIPNVPGTPESRIKAIQVAKTAVSGGGPFTAHSAEATDLIRVATYIETGHDYLDTHPVGKRRPKIHNITVVAPVGATPGQLEHFLEHVKDGSFMDFVEEMKKTREEYANADIDEIISDLFTRGAEPETAEDEESAEAAPEAAPEEAPEPGPEPEKN